MRELDAALYTIAWIAPLEIEAQAARHMLDNRHDGKFPISRGDDYVFLAGDINGHNIVIATLPPGQEYGTGSAAALASQIKNNAAWHAAKLLGGFPLALELAGVLHHREITALDEFAETFTNDYPELAQFEIDSGVWIWTRNGAIGSLF
ncbi:hypothetical protein HZS61_014550 [Fusarium oxysporum f. sp. conglutinans]|uniref:Uncharacterized protein n=1 Tax=Fusarium oxysporum f. sp. conglutinans TaxID=100902 RepID=A0A8H6LJG1_FUSOX|nr:hypothetical protein HZS61_014550 [Fusarium oxysporum f. sp. conglutinans]KAI8412576.1 hypothetical protein FOFC_05834 [Fusarium oxysporum]